MLLFTLTLCLLQSPATGTDPQETPSVPDHGVLTPGEPLHAELGCARCHSSFPGSPMPGRVVLAPALDKVGAQRSAEYLRRYLSDPLHVRPGTRMPDMLAGLEESLREQTVEDLVHYLVTRGGPFDVSQQDATMALLEEGRQLFHELGCIACHGPEEPVEALFEALDLRRDATWTPELVEPAATDLDLLDLAEKTNVSALTEFLMDPVETRRSGRMPSLSLSRPEAQAIASYLLRDQVGAAELEPMPGLNWSYYELGVWGNSLELDGVVPVRTGVLLEEVGLLEHREEEFVFVFEGQLDITEAGDYEFFTNSDDGSQLFVDGELLVDNNGAHAMQVVSGTLHLDAGRHALRITYYELGGDEGLEVSWSGPSFEPRALRGDQGLHLSLSLTPPSSSFEVNAESARAGELAFRAFLCVNCHDDPDLEPLPYGDFDISSPGGCLADEPIAHVPHFGISTAQRLELAGALAGGQAQLPGEGSPERDVEYLFRGARCYACHVRDEFSGPEDSHRAYFFSNGDVDLGEEGRIPPHLDGVGAKLTHAALEGVLRAGETVRPYLVTRMPQFGPQALGNFESAVMAADASDEEAEAPPHDAALAKAGWKLVGTEGFGCIQCHKFAGYDSLGIPAVDLMYVDGRIQYPWFRQLLHDPASINMNTRMPGFWIDGESPVKDVLDGDKDAQIDAIWTYLSQGASMQLPPGLQTPDSAYELSPANSPVLAGVFMRGVSPRTIAVGLPESIHYAFDVENSRLAYVWRGRFLNARGTWEGRAGELEAPASADVLELPRGQPFALLDAQGASWPQTEGREPLLRPLGRKFDSERRPIFRYALGSIEIEEQLVPGTVGGHLTLQRKFRLHSPAPVEHLTFRGSEESRFRVRFRASPNGDGYVAEFETEIQW